MEAIEKNPKVSFCVITKDEIIPEAFNTLYRSVVLFGKARVLTEAEEIQHGIMAIVEKYSGDHIEAGRAYMKAEDGNFCVVEIDIEHITGKVGK